MKDQDLETLVDHAVALHREITVKNEQLKALKAALVKQARLQPELLATTGSSGQRWVAEGSDGSIARVSFPAATLLAEVGAQSDLANKIQEIAGEEFRRLFTPVKRYQAVNDFRTVAALILPKRKAAALLQLCESESSPRVSFEIANRQAASAVAA